MKLSELKNKAQGLYLTLRGHGLSHSLAMAAVVEMIFELSKEVEEEKGEAP